MGNDEEWNDEPEKHTNVEMARFDLESLDMWASFVCRLTGTSTMPNLAELIVDTLSWRCREELHHRCFRNRAQAGRQADKQSSTAAESAGDAHGVACPTLPVIRRSPLTTASVGPYDPFKA